MRCNQCDSCYINGVFCHETGCPNTGKVYDAGEDTWAEPQPEPEHHKDQARTPGLFLPQYGASASPVAGVRHHQSS